MAHPQPNSQSQPESGVTGVDWLILLNLVGIALAVLGLLILAVDGLLQGGLI